MVFDKKKKIYLKHRNIGEEKLMHQDSENSSNDMDYKMLSLSTKMKQNQVKMFVKDFQIFGIKPN